MSVQLSESSDYTGGDLQVGVANATRLIGSAIVFPSYQLHRVHPVQSGERFSLVWFTPFGCEACVPTPAEVAAAAAATAALPAPAAPPPAAAAGPARPPEPAELEPARFGLQLPRL